jgi:hypothetical protein
MTTRFALVALLFAACGDPADQLEVTAASQTIVSAPQQPGCPATWAEARMLCNDATACTTGSRCSYPGVGDQLPDGRWADGALICFDRTGTNASTGVWVCAQ